MRAPQQGRSRDEIVREALEVIKPPADQREAIRAKVLKDIDWLQAFAQGQSRRPAAGEFKERLADYLNALHVAKRKSVRSPSWTEEQERKQFLAILDREIERVAIRHDDLLVKKGARPLDRIARVATERAAEYFLPEQRTLTGNGPWHRLAVLFYQAATGKAGDLMHVLRKFDREIKIVRHRLIEHW
jgi:hypothetical protein